MSDSCVSQAWHAFLLVPQLGSVEENGDRLLGSESRFQPL
jgi:hypothetical protein